MLHPFHQGAFRVFGSGCRQTVERRIPRWSSVSPLPHLCFEVVAKHYQHNQEGVGDGGSTVPTTAGQMVILSA